MVKLTSTPLISSPLLLCTHTQSLSLLRLIYNDLMQEDFSLDDMNKDLIQISPESLLTGFLNSAPCLPDAATHYLVPMLTSLSFLIKELSRLLSPLSFWRFFTALSHIQAFLLLTDSSSSPVISALH